MYKYLEKSYGAENKKGFLIMQKILKLLNSPHDKLKIIHVAGTNGKGSCCAMLNSILIEQGYKVGLFTSPHLHKYNERIKINNSDISDEDFENGISKIKKISDELLDGGSLIFFEILTIVALDYFYANNVDYVILETGIGGRLDSTNIIKKPILSIITSISPDHTNILGGDILKIAAEKAGIIKKSCPLVLYSQTKEVYNVINFRANELNSKIYYLDDSLNISDVEYKLQYTKFSVKHKYFDYKNIVINLLGKYQIYNTSNVLLAVAALRDSGIIIDENSVYKGLLKANWFGRMEIFNINGKTVLLEGAHNIDGVLKLKESLDIYFRNKKIHMVVGFLADKDYYEMFKILYKAANFIYITKPDSKRSVEPKKLFDCITNFENFSESKVSSNFIFDDYKEALGAALLNKNSDVICVAGSLYLIGNIRQYINNNYKISIQKR